MHCCLLRQPQSASVDLVWSQLLHRFSFELGVVTGDSIPVDIGHTVDLDPAILCSLDPVDSSIAALWRPAEDAPLIRGVPRNAALAQLLWGSRRDG